MTRTIISREKIDDAIDQGLNVYECAERFNCCKNTITNTLKRYGISTPSKFYTRRNSRVGRPPGFTYTEEERKQMSERMIGELNPFYGKKHTQATRKKMSENHPDISGSKNPFRKSLEHDREKRGKHSRRCKAIWLTRDDNYRQEFGRKVSLGLANSDKSTMSYKRHKSGFINTAKAGRLFFRSSWEKAVCEFLDQCAKVDQFQLEPFAVEYTNSKGFTRYTRLDFLVTLTNDTRAVFEVKPKTLIEYNENPYKIRGQREYCRNNSLQFYVIHKQDLNNLEKLISMVEGGELYVT